MSANVRISVRHLVEYVLRQGSIMTGYMSSKSLTEGIKIHQRIQNEQVADYRKEVWLEAVLPLGEGLELLLEGRLDGLLEGDEPYIEEIKSTSRDVSLLTIEDYPEYWAQAKLYAFMYSRSHGEKDLAVQLTYVQVHSGEEVRFRESYTFAELENFTNELLAKFLPYVTWKLHWEQERNQSIEHLAFPFQAYRKGQRELAVSVYKAIQAERRLFVKAPTGIGKTISTIFPTVKAFSEQKLERFFYLTAKTSGRTVAEDTFRMLHEKGLQMKVITITAKEKACLQDEVNCNKDVCPFADGYYDRINEAILDVLHHENLLDAKTIERYAKKHQVCPFEFSLDLASEADVIIGDYNYWFDPKASLKRFQDKSRKRTVLLLDEAHNLLDRARDMFSAELFKSAFLSGSRLTKGVHAELHITLKAINQFFIQWKKELTETVSIERKIPEDLHSLLNKFTVEADLWLWQNRRAEGANEITELYWQTQSFLRIADLYDERFVTVVEKVKNDLRIKLLCLDPAELLRDATKQVKGTVYFSATLTPLDYFKEVLGGTHEDLYVSLPSPFFPEQINGEILPLSTRYKDRERTALAIADKIVETLKAHRGNFLVFFPSYQYMNLVSETMGDRVEGRRILIQSNTMSDEEKQEFLRAFSATSEIPVVGFAVLGGQFAEGIDLVGDRLTGVIVVGVGMPQIGVERDVMKEYYSSIGKPGFDYAYVYPGMNKVLQAGGRLIRTEEDQGVLLLIDDRFMTKQYEALLPAEWSNLKRTERNKREW